MIVSGESTRIFARGRNRLSVRHGVVVREFARGSEVLWYLSLLEDEIDDRLLQLSSSLGGAPLREVDPTLVELTDVVVVHANTDELTVIRGGASTVPCFWTRNGGDIELSTQLPVRGGGALSRNGLLAAAVKCGSGSYEPNAWTDTPLAGWSRIRRGVRTTFVGCSIKEDVVELPDFGGGPPADDIDAIARSVREAFEAFSRAQRPGTAIFELSGGFDSTLAAAGALRAGSTLQGVSVEFPYYEFRFEADVQRAVARHLRVKRTILDGTALMPYAPTERSFRFDEPTVFATGMRHAEVVAELASTLQGDRIYMGHGGDQLFNTNIDEPEPTDPRPSLATFSRPGQRAVKRIIHLGHDTKWRRRTAACFVYDARQDIVMREVFGQTIRTPFTDLAVWRAARRWTLWSTAHGRRPDKSILADALPGWLADAVVNRRGKVAYDGVWVRSYAHHADDIGGAIERAGPLLREIGMSQEWLLRRVHELASWEDVPDREVIGAYGVASWFNSWEFDSPRHVSWS